MKSYASLTVPTVERLVCTEFLWSIATAGLTPSIQSTAGFSIRSRNCLA